ncbi:MAG TPA: hypothetical protein VJ804_14845 [Acidimicrobiales bacterium]|nr:hypothetical protein [Acidimicrobiales bacterium]
MARWLVRAAVVGMVAMWAFVLYLAVFEGRADSPDRLDDPAFAREAEAACSARLERIVELPRASEARDAAERARTLEVANGHLADMLEDLEELVPLVPAGEDREIVEEWLADWHTYLGDREDYAAELLRDPDARLLVTAKGGEQVTEYLDQFAGDNDMPACSTAADA